MALVAVTDHVFPDLDQERRLLADAGHELRFGSNAASVEEVRDAVAGADAVLNCYAPMPGEVIRGLDRCVVIARYGIGVDTIDLDEATSKGIVVTTRVTSRPHGTLANAPENFHPRPSRASFPTGFGAMLSCDRGTSNAAAASSFRAIIASASGNGICQ